MIIITQDADFEIIEPKQLPMSNIQCIAEHSVDLSLITRESKVLDLGCRAFTWSKAMLEYVDKIECVDADPYINSPDTRLHFTTRAIWGESGLELPFIKFGNGTGNHLFPAGGKKDSQIIRVYTSDLVDATNDTLYDLIKIDIEGAEVNTLLAIKKPPAIQLSVEFHMHTGTTEETILKVFEHLKQWYEIAFVDKSEKHGCGMNYWDVLFIEKITEATRLFKRNVGNYK